MSEDYFDHEEALAELLKAEVLFCNSRKYVDIKFIPKEGATKKNGGYSMDDVDCVDGPISEKATIVLFVNCNDVFAWGCADAEELPIGQLETLYKMFKEDSHHGVTKWCCIQRNEKPQDPIVHSMKRDKVWSAEMENLPDNGYWTNLKKRRK